MTLSRRTACLAAALAIAALLGCTRSAPQPAATGPDPETRLRLGFTPSEENVIGRREAQAALGRYLSRTLGMPVDLVQTASYGPAVDALASGGIDLINLGPFAYLLASERGVADALAVTGLPDSGPRTYRSALIAHPGSGVTTLGDLTTRASSLRFNYTDPASNSGHLVPRALLAGIGIRPDRDFASVDFTLSHSVAILNVAYGRAEVAGVSYSAYGRLIDRSRLSADQIRILWLSEPLPAGPIAVRRALPAHIKAAILDALVSLPAREPITWAAVMRQYDDPRFVFLRCEDSLYDGLRALERSGRPLD